jgi:hypothetical protein
MYFVRRLSPLAILLASVLAQNAPQFNFVPDSITAGQSYTFTWSGGSGGVSRDICFGLSVANSYNRP